MKNFFGLSIVASLAVFATACSSSTTTTTVADEDSGAHTGPSGDAGGSTADSGTGDDAGTCAPTIPSTLPALTAPTAATNACAAGDITAFVAACGSASSGTSCSGYIGGDAGTSACHSCLLGTGNAMAPLELFDKQYVVPSIGGCLIAAQGFAAAVTKCAADIDNGNLCGNEACVTCSDSTADSCVQSASTGGCGSFSTAAQTDCTAYVAAIKSCESEDQDTFLAAAATGLCGSGAVATTDAGTGTGDAGTGDAGK